MTDTKQENDTNKWVARRLTCNLGAKHAGMLDELVQERKKNDHRTNMTTVIESAIEALHTSSFGERV